MEGGGGVEFAHGAIENEDWLFSTYCIVPIKLYGFSKKIKQSKIKTLSTEKILFLSSVLQHGELVIAVEYFYDSSNYNYHRHVTKYNNA